MASFAKWFNGRATAVRIHWNWWRSRARNNRRRHANERWLRNAHQNKILPVRIDAPVGFFAHLSWCLRIAAYCESHRLTPHITCTSGQYGEGGRDWFANFFQQPSRTSPTTRAAETQGRVENALLVRNYEELPFYNAPDLACTLVEAAQLQQKYFPVVPAITAKVDAFVAEHFPPAPIATIGCHFRGTDKGGLEAARIAYDEMTAALRVALSAYPEGQAALFIATDEAAFLQHIRFVLPQTRVISADHKRSSDGRALHFSTELNGLAQGEEALVDCLLLSRCTALVKSPSALSAWAKVFNRSLPVTLVGRPYAHTMFFPESAIVAEADRPKALCA